MKVTKTIETTVTQCDFCGTHDHPVTGFITAFQQCHNCGRDLCAKHERWTYYPGYLYQMFCYCPTCYQEVPETEGMKKREYDEDVTTA